MSDSVSLTPIQPDDYLRFQFLAGAALSPDGSRILYAVSSINPESKNETTALWMLDLTSGESRPFSAGGAHDYSTCWSPDGKQVAYLSTRAGAPQIYLQLADGGEALPLTDLKLGVGGGPAWSPDGIMLAFTAAAAKEMPDLNQPVRVDRHVWRFNAMGYLHLSQQNIYTINIKSREVTQLTDEGWMHTNPLWSPDGEEILFFANLPPDSHNIYDYKICTVNRQGKVRVIVPLTSLALAAAWTPDGKWIVYSGTQAGLPVFSNTDLWVVSSVGGEPQNRTAGLNGSITYGLQGDLPERFASQICVSPDGSTAYCDVQTGGTVGIYEIALQGEENWQQVVSGNRSAHLVGMSDGFVYAGRDFFHPSNLYHCHINGTNERKLTRLNDDLLEHRIQPEVIDLRYPSADGQQIEGWLMKPTHGSPPYPTILYIHGGPQAAFGSTFSFDFNLLAGAGFAVLFTNPRGSSGYGSDFTTAIIGDLGGLDYKDIMAGIDHAVGMGLADPERLGITGASYGGYMTCMCIGKTNRFKAAVAESPVTDFVSVYGTSDLGAFLCTGALGGAPHQVPEVYRRCSPITYAHNVTTPTLLIHNEDDLRSPSGQPEQFYTALKVSGCTVEMLRLPRSHHGGTFRGPVEVRLAQNQALLEWMERDVKSKSEKQRIEKRGS